MGERSRILVVGATGNLGSLLVKASIGAGHPTFALARGPAFSIPHKSQLLQSLAADGATVLKGSLEDYASLMEAVRRVDVVICAVPSKQVLEQKSLVRAIKEAGCIKRFIPAEFGADPDKVSVIGLDYEFYERKLEIRRLIESEGIPYTYVCCNFYMSYLLPSLVQPGKLAPPRDKVTIFGDGDTKAIFVKEWDVARFTICTVDDPRSLNKVMYLRPPGNICSINELVDIWETKIGKKLEREHVHEEQVLNNIREIPYPRNMELIFLYSAFIKGDHTYFDIDPSSGVDGVQLYSKVRYTTVDEYLDSIL